MPTPSCARDPIFEKDEKVLTFWHARCTFIVSQTRMGAIPEAESQQNADGARAQAPDLSAFSFN
jgi:hypothetical protein